MPARRASDEAVFFTKPEAFRRWLEKNHESADELWVGYYRKGTGRASITWPESVEEALRFGWIDGIRRSIDEERYRIRFTPRRARSTWSRKNIETMERLIEEGRVAPAGMAAWERRREENSGRYSFEQEGVELPEKYLKRFRTNRTAWRHFQAESESYRRTVTWWVISAKREATRERRLAMLIAECAAKRRIPQLRR